METDAKYGGARDARRSTTDDPRIAYIPREDATPEGELAALAAVYAFILKCSEQRQIAAEVSNSKHETSREEVNVDERG